MSRASCPHAHWLRRPDEDVGLRCRFRCPQCGARGWRRFDEPDSKIRAFLDADEIEHDAEIDLEIETRFRLERIEGGAHISLGECNGDAIYHPRGECP